MMSFLKKEILNLNLIYVSNDIKEVNTVPVER
jgi:hypothetical protein